MASPANDGEDRRHRILEAAVAVFARDGRHAARIQDIADAAGVAYGLVYHYFGTKDALLQTIYDDNWRLFADVAEAVAARPDPPAERVRAIVDYALGALHAFPDRVRIIILEYGRSAGLSDPTSHPDVARVLAAVTRILKDASDAGTLDPSADPDTLAWLWMGTLEAAVATTSLSDDHRPDAETLRRTVHAVVAAPLRPTES